MAIMIFKFHAHLLNFIVFFFFSGQIIQYITDTFKVNSLSFAEKESQEDIVKSFLPCQPSITKSHKKVRKFPGMLSIILAAS